MIIHKSESQLTCIDVPCHLEQMLPKSGYDIGILGPLIKILQTLHMCEILLFICVLREGDGNVFASDPLIKVIFDLELEPMSHEEETKYDDLQLSIQEQLLSRRAFRPWRTQGGSHHRPFCLGTKSC